MPRSEDSATSITCRKCKRTSHNPNDVLYGWCPGCNLFQYEIDNPHTGDAAPPIQLDLIVGEIQRSLRMWMGRGGQVSLLIEPYMSKDPTMRWRAAVMLNGRPHKCSQRAQYSPQDALRELYELVKGTLQEDI